MKTQQILSQHKEFIVLEPGRKDPRNKSPSPQSSETRSTMETQNSSIDKLKGIQQYFIKNKNGHKFEIIKQICSEIKNTQTIIYVNTKSFADAVFRKLDK